MDVNGQAVLDALDRHNVSRLIHGHTHRPAVHQIKTTKKIAERIVLGDWYEQGSVLKISSQNGMGIQHLRENDENAAR
jgi:UDP-2,3-diacylglucosamine hydrolase